MRVLIVDDSGFMRKALTQMIGSDPTLEVVGQATNGKEAVEMAQRLKPDVITLDIEMPVMDGMGALRAIKETCKDFDPAVLMCSSLTHAGSQSALAAMAAGASDVIAKDASHFSVNIREIQEELIEKIKAIGGTRAKRALRRGAAGCAGIGAGGGGLGGGSASPKAGPTATVSSTLRALRATDLDLVAIGSSTGGPPVLEKILTRLSPSGGPPIVIAQHMPMLFTRSMAERLSQACKIKVVHAEDGMEIGPGEAAISPGGKQTRVVRVASGAVKLEVNETPAKMLYKPSVNELFNSVARVCKSRSLAIVLTGMGDDGMLGSKAIREAGGRVVAQDADSCVVYGMPRAVAECGASEASMSPDEVIRLLAGLASGGAGAMLSSAA
jgi:two-component system, chemotaxis family, protein-glutamate methylesterase/glutaminase